MMQKQEAKLTTRVFLSYSSEDAWYARTLLNRLAKHPNVSVFETQSLSAGENWQHKLRQELVRCSIFLVVLSTRSVKSPWVLYELGAAWALGKRIIGVITHPEVRSQIPVEVRQIHLVEAEDLEDPEAVSRILENYGGEATFDNGT